MVRDWVRRGALAVAVAGLLFSLVPQAPIAAQDERPELSLRARPNLGFAPAEIIFTGRLQGGVDDDEEFYCLNAEWDWDDETRSESLFDCDPYEPGVSAIRRRYSRRHTFQYGGRYEVRLSLKRGDDLVDSARTAVQIQGL
jgi:hypothetical protein